MQAPHMSDNCKLYIRSMIRGDLRSAFQQLSLLEDKELLRGLAAADRADIDDLFDKEPESPPGFAPGIPGVGAVAKGPMLAAMSAAALGGRVLSRMSQLVYAYEVVKSGKLQFEKDAKPPTGSIGMSATEYVHHCVALQQIPLEIDEDLTGKLPNPVANPPTLTDADFVSAATTLGVDVPAMKAVARVESAGSGFGDDGRPIIRYELHRFQRKTHRLFHKSHPYLSQPSLDAGKPYHNGTQGREYTLLYNAMILELKGVRTIDQAISSTSWGKFQVMGENWSDLGWSSALAFASDMYVSEANQLDAFVKFVRRKGLTSALKNHNWAAFAAGYNGPNYADNDYDANLQRAYTYFSRAQAAGAHH
jgi:hypothetical protein